jgi:hypothetical protein
LRKNHFMGLYYFMIDLDLLVYSNFFSINQFQKYSGLINFNYLFKVHHKLQLTDFNQTGKNHLTSFTQLEHSN